MSDQPNPFEGQVLKLERGGVYVIELQYSFRTQEEFETFRKSLGPFEAKHGVSFLILEPGVRIARQYDSSLQERPDYMHKVAR